ncbi:hypothetical protein T492DRAFT_97675 [Pavlovales sp. CCMP2436]|nr:hypothetical protein T492DRAFT_97675 [Pavlovales sp. CCMP2436]
MNYEHCQLEELEVEHFQVKEVLRCLLHSILYQRILGATPSNRHREEESTLFEISYLCFDDESVRTTVEERIDAFAKSLDRANEARGQVDLSFFERRQRKGLLGLHNVEERVCWERWSVCAWEGVHRVGGGGCVDRMSWWCVCLCVCVCVRACVRVGGDESIDVGPCVHI